MVHMGDEFSRRDELPAGEVTKRLNKVYSKPENQPTDKFMAALKKVQRRAIEPEYHSDEQRSERQIREGGL